MIINENNRQMDFVVFSMKLAKFLRDKGYMIKETRPDLKGSGRDIFVFYDTPQLRQAIDAYMTN